MRRIALLLALLTALGPASLRWIHQATAHDHGATHQVACEGSHHHDHDATHEGDDDSRSVPTHDDDCDLCGAMATVTAFEMPFTALVLPVPRAVFEVAAPTAAMHPAPLAALRAIPPPVA
jgi:hypothetical protein